MPLLMDVGVGGARSRLRRWVWLIPLLLLLIGSMPTLQAARVGDLGDLNLKRQALRFLSFKDPAVRHAVLGSALIGVSCGLFGCFLVVRKMALTGDVLSHAVLPGVAIGYLWNLSKTPPYPILIGATLAGLLGIAIVRLLLNTTRLKEDSVLGIVLTVFFAFGVCLLTMIQRLPTGSKSGIDKFLFGQAAAISSADLWMMGGIAVLAVTVVSVLFKELLATSFDAVYARTIGLPTRWVEGAFILLLAMGIVVALQAVGVVLVSAMLITPAAAAYLLTDRLNRMLWLSSLFGVMAGVLGAFCSFMGNNLPTGPFMVLAASSVFACAFLFAPKHGVVTRWWRHRSSTVRIRMENTLKSFYHVLEARQFEGDGVSVLELATRRRETLDEIRGRLKELVDHELVTTEDDRGVAFLTPSGWKKACSIVRNHRLWELYLNHAAQVPADHVHDEAEKIEHVLGEDAVRELEKKLAYARVDPHGRLIPDLAQIQKGLPTPTETGRATGYGR